MINSEKPLSDAQERALIALVDLARSERDQGTERRWHDVGVHASGFLYIHGGTVGALERRDLIETDYSRWPVASLARATDAGIALCDSMGD